MAEAVSRAGKGVEAATGSVRTASCQEDFAEGGMADRLATSPSSHRGWVERGSVGYLEALAIAQAQDSSSQYRTRNGTGLHNCQRRAWFGSAGRGELEQAAAED